VSASVNLEAPRIARRIPRARPTFENGKGRAGIAAPQYARVILPSTWTVEATERKRERLARISDEDFLRNMESAHCMCSPGSYWGERPGKAYVIQRELVRLEIAGGTRLMGQA